MNASAFPKPSLRPYLASDLPLLAEIRFAAIEELTVDDYDEGQRRAWASAADDDEVLGQSLRNALTLIALIGGSPVGFIALQNGGLIDQLYVHPAVARTGVASTLCDAIERLATARGIAALVTDASDTAKPLFEKRGFVPERRNTIEIDGQWLGNTRMKKVLAPKAQPDERQ
ncbi:GNAT family N-acetyltransferase [Beijerinckiaceae bacterium]|nr:GNAT family N-acetyltransferase [Beijerinckiaceae bacterium]